MEGVGERADRLAVKSEHGEGQVGEYVHNRLISERARSIPASGIRKFFDLIASMDGVISLGVGEPDFVTPWHIREAAIYSLERGYTSYTSNYGLLELREELAACLATRYGVGYAPTNELLITAGVSEALDLAMRAILDPGDEVIMADPCYVAYRPCVMLAGGIPITLRTTASAEFKLSADAVAAAITPRTKAILLGYPSNPTGAVMARPELQAIADVAVARNLTVVADEIYDRLVYEGEHTCFAALPGMQDRTILLGGFSKSYAMTGWRIGYAAGHAEIIEAMMKVHQYTLMCAPTMGQKAAVEALRRGEADVREMVEDYDQRRRVMVKGLRDIGLSCFMPRGAFYAFPSVTSTGLSDEEFAERLLLEQKVAVVPGSAFGEGGRGHIRCCYATALDSIDDALERMARFVQSARAA